MSSKSFVVRIRESLVFAAVAGSISIIGCAPQAGLQSKTLAASQSGLSLDQGTSILGGVDATGTEDFAQSVVGLYNMSSSGLCTASIVSDSLLVTAAHCVDGTADKLRIIFGTSVLTTDKPRVIKAADSFKTSPIWPFRQNEETNSGDIALVKFSGGLPPGFKPAQILKDRSQLQNNAPVLLAGYGITDGVTHAGAGVLRSVQVTIENAAYSESEVLVAQHDKRGACHGDSGGPAYVRVNGQLFLWGVTNRGVNDPNNDCTVSAAYADILFYQDWLQKTAAELMAAKPVQTAAKPVAVQAAR